MPRFADMNDPYLSPPERWPADPPDYWVEELRRVIDIDGVELVVYRDQDGDEFVEPAEGFEERHCIAWSMPHEEDYP